MELTDFFNSLSQALSDNNQKTYLQRDIFSDLIRQSSQNKKFLKALPLLLEQATQILSEKEVVQIFSHFGMSYHYELHPNEIILATFIKQHGEKKDYENFIQRRSFNWMAYLGNGFNYYTKYLNAEEKKEILHTVEFFKEEYKNLEKQKLLSFNVVVDLLVGIYGSIYQNKHIYSLNELIDFIELVKDKIVYVQNDNFCFQFNHPIHNYDFAYQALLSPLEDKNYPKLFEILNIDLPLLYSKLDISSILAFFKQGHIQLLDENFSYLPKEMAVYAFNQLCNLQGIQKGRGHRIVETLVKMSVEQPERVYVLCKNLDKTLKKEFKIENDNLNGYEALLEFINKNMPKSKTLQGLEETISNMHTIQSIYEQNKFEKSIGQNVSNRKKIKI